MKDKKKIRVEFRKNRSKAPRPTDLTRKYQGNQEAVEEMSGREMVRAKGDISRKRTIIASDDGVPVVSAENSEKVISGRVVQVNGLLVDVQANDGNMYRCTVRRLLKTLATDERNAVTTGDKVQFFPDGQSKAVDHESGENFPTGVIQTVEPRKGILTRISKNREHVLVSNIDQVVFVISLCQPDLKPHLVDRYISGAIAGKIKPILCFNKLDLVDPAEFQWLVGYYSQLRIPAFLTSTLDGNGVSEIRSLLIGKQSVFCGQSGVGKSSLLNAIQPGLSLRIGEVSDVNQKGKHTTTASKLVPLEKGGWVVDTPGIRQFELQNQDSSEVESYFLEFHPLIPKCTFANCSHTHEKGCAIKREVFRRTIQPNRYMSYLGMIGKQS